MLKTTTFCDEIDFGWLENKHILVTGATGLIGSRLVACLRHLLDQGMDFFVYGQFRSTVPSFMAQAVNHPKIVMFRRDFSYQSMDIGSLYDVIIHAAGSAQAQYFSLNPLATITMTTAALPSLIYCLTKGGRLLFLSSSMVYCGSGGGVFNENEIGATPIDHPHIAYIEAKRMGEVLCKIYRENLGACIKVARLGVTYGPGARWDDSRALNSFIRSALETGRIRLLDNGSAIHQYCYIDDAVELLWQILLHGEHSVYNVGGRSEVSIMDVARTAMRETEAWLTFSTKPGLPGASERIWMDTQRVNAEFGKTQYVSLEEGVRRTVQWYKELYEDRQ